MTTENTSSPEQPKHPDLDKESNLNRVMLITPYLALTALIGAGVVSGVKHLVERERSYDRNHPARIAEINQNKPALVAGKTFDVIDRTIPYGGSNGYGSWVGNMPAGSETNYYLKLRQRQIHNGHQTTVTELEPVDEHIYFNVKKGENVIYSKLLEQEDRYQESHK